MSFYVAGRCQAPVDESDECSRSLERARRRADRPPISGPRRRPGYHNGVNFRAFTSVNSPKYPGGILVLMPIYLAMKGRQRSRDLSVGLAAFVATFQRSRGESSRRNALAFASVIRRQDTYSPTGSARSAASPAICILSPYYLPGSGEYSWGQSR